MAVLQGRNFVKGEYGLEVVPIPPAVDGPHDAYQVTLTHEGQVVYNQSHSVHGWQSGHYYVYDIAYAFQSASRLVDAKLDFSIYEVAPAWTNKWNETAHLHASTDWLQFTLSGRTDKYRGRLIHVFALLETPQEDGSEMEHYLGVPFPLRARGSGAIREGAADRM